MIFNMLKIYILTIQSFLIEIFLFQTSNISFVFFLFLCCSYLSSQQFSLIVNIYMFFMASATSFNKLASCITWSFFLFIILTMFLKTSMKYLFIFIYFLIYTPVLFGLQYFPTFLDFYLISWFRWILSTFELLLN